MSVPHSQQHGSGTPAWPKDPWDLLGILLPTPVVCRPTDCNNVSCK